MVPDDTGGSIWSVNRMRYGPGLAIDGVVKHLENELNAFPEPIHDELKRTADGVRRALTDPGSHFLKNAGMILGRAFQGGHVK